VSDDRPNLNARGPRPAPAAAADPIDPPTGRRYVPNDTVYVAPRQFRLRQEEDEMLHRLQEFRGDRKLVDTVRWLIMSVGPRVISGEIK
jgi:hypothetical protein